MTYVVAIYDCDRAYGGPEEGGWYFDCGELVRVVRTFKNEEKALAFARRYNDLLHLQRQNGGGGRYDISSVCYQGGHYAAHVYERYAPEYYPKERPYYC